MKRLKVIKFRNKIGYSAFKKGVTVEELLMKQILRTAYFLA